MLPAAISSCHNVSGISVKFFQPSSPLAHALRLHNVSGISVKCFQPPSPLVIMSLVSVWNASSRHLLLSSWINDLSLWWCAQLHIFNFKNSKFRSSTFSQILYFYTDKIVLSIMLLIKSTSTHTLFTCSLFQCKNSHFFGIFPYNDIFEQIIQQTNSCLNGI